MGKFPKHGLFYFTSPPVLWPYLYQHNTFRLFFVLTRMPYAPLQYIGITSVADLVAFVFKGTLPGGDSSLSEVEARKIRKQRLNSRVADAIGSTNESLSLWCEDEMSSISTVLEICSKGVHRIIVTSTEKDVPVKILTQSDLITFVLSFAREKPSSMVATLLRSPMKFFVTSLPTGNMVQCVSIDTPVLVALELMLSEKVSGLPVFDGNGRLVSTVSLSDFRGIHGSNLETLVGETIGLFLRRIERERCMGQARILPSQAHQEGLRVPLVCSLEATLGEALQLALMASVHRIWIVDRTRDVVSVISFTDAIALFRAPPPNS